MAVQQWYYRKGNKRRGPVSSAELKALAASGDLEPTDFLRGVGMSEWIPASKVKGLFAPAKPRPKVEEELGLAPPPESKAEPPKPRPKPVVAPPPVQAPPVLPQPTTPPAPQGFAAAADPSNPFAQFGLEQGPAPMASPDPFAGAPGFNPPENNPFAMPAGAGFPANDPFGGANMFDNLAALGSQGQALPQAPRPIAASAGYAPAAPGRSNLYDVAWRQRAMVYAYLIIYFFVFLALIALMAAIAHATSLAAEGTMSQEEITAAVASSGSIKMYQFFLICTYPATLAGAILTGMLAKSLRYGIAAAILLGFMFLFIGLILLIILNMQANEQLRRGGYRPGFLGVNPNRIR